MNSDLVEKLSLAEAVNADQATTEPLILVDQLTKAAAWNSKIC